MWSYLLTALALVHDQHKFFEAPGNPIAIRIGIINNAGAELELNSAASTIAKGNYTSPPAESIEVYGSGYNVGYAITPDATGAINSTTLYAAAGGGAYAVITAFAKDPALPGLFGVQVNSNIKEATITLYSTLFGDGPTTELDCFVHIDPPS